MVDLPAILKAYSMRRNLRRSGWQVLCPALYGHRRKYDKVSRAYFQEVYSV